MKHNKKGRTLGRKKGQRTALLRALARSLVMHEKITTTIARAKELRPFVEQLVTKAKKGDINSRRLISRRLGGSADTVAKLHATIAPRYAARAGGYTRIIKLGPVGKRMVDSAVIEFVQ